MANHCLTRKNMRFEDSSNNKKRGLRFQEALGVPNFMDWFSIQPVRRCFGEVVGWFGLRFTAFGSFFGKSGIFQGFLHFSMTNEH